MRRAIRPFVAVSWLLAAQIPYASAFDATAVLRDISAARQPATLQLPPGAIAAPLGAADVQAIQAARVEKEEEAAFRLMSTCEGRFGSLRAQLERQVSRAEWISTVGGVVGVIGAVATCPHCAALAAGVAGLANPLQQTFRANADTPQDTQDQLNRLSAKIQTELDRYLALPPAVPGDPTFEANLRSRLDALFMVTASCSFYSTSLAQAIEAPAPAAPATP
jgi:hypothetical protein